MLGIPGVLRFGCRLTAGERAAWEAGLEPGETLSGWSGARSSRELCAGGRRRAPSGSGCDGSTSCSSGLAAAWISGASPTFRSTVRPSLPRRSAGTTLGSHTEQAIRRRP